MIIHFIKILRKPLRLIGFKFPNEPAPAHFLRDLTGVIFAYLFLNWFLLGFAWVVSSYLPVPLLYQLYLGQIVSLLLSIPLVVAAYFILTIKYASNPFDNIVLKIFIGGFYAIGAGAVLWSTSNIFYDGLGSKTEVIETSLLFNDISANHISSTSRYDVICGMIAEVERDNKAYDYGCEDPNTTVLKEDSDALTYPSNNLYRLTVLLNSQYILRAERISK